MGKKILKIVGISILGIILAIILFFAVLLLAQYKPEDVETVSEYQEGIKTLQTGDEVKIMTWNIGYASLGENADFFMDGGTMVDTSTPEQIKENIKAFNQVINEQNCDVVMLQEVDVDSKRSHHVNVLEGISKEKDYISTFATNFKVLYVPYPIPNIGRVYSGIETLQKYTLDNSERIQLYCPFNWFVRAFNLRRCLMVNRIPVENSDKELVIVNLHLEAYDSGEGKIRQAEQLKAFIESEYKKGNYVIAGGDFNQVFSNVDISEYPKISDDMWMPASIDVSVFDGFTAVTDAAAPTCRSLDKVYKDSDKSSFQYYVIDGFLVSDNLEIIDVTNLNLDFKNTDHNPIVLNVKLK